MKNLHARIYKQDWIWINENIDNTTRSEDIEGVGIFKDMASALRESVRLQMMSNTDLKALSLTGTTSRDLKEVPFSAPEGLIQFLEEEENVDNLSAGVRESVSDMRVAYDKLIL